MAKAFSTGSAEVEGVVFADPKARAQAVAVRVGAKPVGATRQVVIAHGSYKHPTKWGRDEKGREVPLEFVVLGEGDAVTLSEDEIRRMDPHGHKFVTPERFKKLKERAEVKAQERAEQLAAIAKDENAPAPESPADALLGNQKENDPAKRVTK